MMMLKRSVVLRVIRNTAEVRATFRAALASAALHFEAQNA